MTNVSMKPWIYTFSGKQVDPTDLNVEDIHIIDIAHALALCNRFAGHTRQPISVAQHSVYVTRLVRGSSYFQLFALLHDASEAYLGDVTKWLKGAPEMEFYRRCEDEAQEVIINAFLGHWIPSAEEIETLDWADRVMVRFEGEVGYGQKFLIDHPRYPPLTTEEYTQIGAWQFWEWQQAEANFLDLFTKLRQQCVAL